MWRLILLGLALAGCRREYAGSYGYYPEYYAWDREAKRGLTETFEIEDSLPYYAAVCDSFERVTDTTVVVGADTLKLTFNYFNTHRPQVVPTLYLEGRCRFKVQENYVNNYAVKIDGFLNKKPIFSKTFYKDEFNAVLTKDYLRNNVMVGADFFGFNHKHRQAIFRFSFAEAPGGTSWFAQAYATVGLDGKVAMKGLVDFPHHCQNPISLSRNQDFLLTCSEIAHFPTRKIMRHPASVVMTKFINDSLYSIIYSFVKDSTLCDTVIYWGADTLRYADHVATYDTLSQNAFIMHVNGDTMAAFQFSGFTDYGEGYWAEYDQIFEMSLVGFYDFRKRTVHTFDMSRAAGYRSYTLRKLKKLGEEPSGKYMRFTAYDPVGKPAILKLFVNPQRSVVGYTLDSGTGYKSMYQTD